MRFFQRTLVLSFFTFFLFSAQTTFGQKKLKSGIVVYEVTDVVTNIPELKLMKGSKTTLYFSPEKQKIAVDLNNEAVKIQTFYNSRTGAIEVLYDFMEQYYRVPSNQGDLRSIKSYIKKISYDKFETKIIAGYPCFKAELTFEDDKLILWVTDRIKVKNPDFQRIFPGLEGFPLEYKRHGENTIMTFKAKSVSNILPEDAFIISDKYQEMSEKEFEEKMGGMKFGF